MSRIKLLLDVVEDMKALSESLLILAKAIEDPEETDNEEAAEQMEETEQTDEEEVATEAKETEPVQYQMEDVRRTLSAKSSAGKTAEIRELLLRHGAPRLSAINPSEYPAMMREAEEL